MLPDVYVMLNMYVTYIMLNMYVCYVMCMCMLKVCINRY